MQPTLLRFDAKRLFAFGDAPLLKKIQTAAKRLPRTVKKVYNKTYFFHPCHRPTYPNIIQPYRLRLPVVTVSWRVGLAAISKCY